MERLILTHSARSTLRNFNFTGISSTIFKEHTCSIATSPWNYNGIRKKLRITLNTADAKRSYHASFLKYNNNNNNTTTRQAYPLSGYYSDVLSFHQPSSPQQHLHPSSTTNHNTSPEPQQEQTKEQKMAIVFGTRLAGPGYQSSSSRYNPNTMPPESTWKQINGVPIPPRPTEPDNCCMSGCVHCVWDDYRDDLEHWALRVREASSKGKGARVELGLQESSGQEMRQTPRKEVASASASMDDDGGGSETNWELPVSLGVTVEEDLFKGIPVGIREFMKTEKKLKEKKLHEVS